MADTSKTILAELFGSGTILGVKFCGVSGKSLVACLWSVAIIQQLPATLLKLQPEDE